MKLQILFVIAVIVVLSGSLRAQQEKDAAPQAFTPEYRAQLERNAASQTEVKSDSNPSSPSESDQRIKRIQDLIEHEDHLR